MNKFEKQLEKWNHGVLRGAQAKLAKALQVSTATTALWATGKRHPSKGYIRQMAVLFGLDDYQVLKLFEANHPVIYPNPDIYSPVHAFRENTNAMYEYSPVIAEPKEDTQSNSVTLPFLSTPAAHYPQYPEDTIIEWWSIPRRYAQGAKYIVRSQDIQLKDCSSTDDLCFIKPGTDIADGDAILFNDSKGNYSVWRAQATKHGFTYRSLSQGLTKQNASDVPIGKVIRRINPF